MPIPGTVNLTIENTENRKENFHGIRFKGRIITEDTNVGFSSGFISVQCLPTTAQTVPVYTGATVMNDNNDFIIAIEPFMVKNGAAGAELNAETGSIYDFDFRIEGTSRTCSRGGRIIGQVHNDSTSSNTVIFNALLSTFRTIA